MVYLNIALLLVFLAILGRYLFSLYTEGSYRPEQWARLIKTGKIHPELRKAYRAYPDKVRFMQWWLQVERLKKEKVTGAFAELGVYKGESARVIHLMDPSRTFHLFDTFNGFMDADLKKEEGEAASYTPEHFSDTSLNKVKDYLHHAPCFRYHPGYFPSTARAVEKETFALVNIDADLYNPIKAGLEFFYPRLARGGVLFVHDYNDSWEGCRRALDEFAATIREPLILLPDKDGSVMIVRQ